MTCFTSIRRRRTGTKYGPAEERGWRHCDARTARRDRGRRSRWQAPGCRNSRSTDIPAPADVRADGRNRSADHPWPRHLFQMIQSIRQQIARLSSVSARARSSGVLMLKNGSTGAEGKTTRALGKLATKSSIFRKPWPRSTLSDVTGRLRAPHRENGVMAFAARGNGDFHVAALRFGNESRHHVGRKERAVASKACEPACVGRFARIHSKPLRIPASGPKNPPMRSAMTSQPREAKRFRSPFALMMSSSTCGRARDRPFDQRSAFFFPPFSPPPPRPSCPPPPARPPKSFWLFWACRSFYLTLSSPLAPPGRRPPGGGAVSFFLPFLPPPLHSSAGKDR